MSEEGYEMSELKIYMHILSALAFVHLLAKVCEISKKSYTR